MDGQDIARVTQDSLRSQIGVVLQDTILLSGSIRENLLLGREKAREAELWRALEQAGAADFVRDAPGGLDAELGERGANLSGGQRQRLAIARTFLKDRRSSSLTRPPPRSTPRSEAKIHDSVLRLFSGRTALIIAHRLSTVVHCDRIADRPRPRGRAGPARGADASQSLYAELVRKQMTPQRRRRR